MYSLATTSNIDKIFFKLKKKNMKQLNIIYKKVEQIMNNPYCFKPLRGDMSGSRRVHIDKSFVLTYEIDERNKILTLLDYDRHDNIY